MIGGVLFDSGDVLIGPRGGRWWPVLGFEDAVRTHVPDASFENLQEAMVRAKEYMDATHPNEDWKEFNSIILDGLGIEPSAEMLEDILKLETVVDIFPDVIPCLDRLRARGIRMAVVSDSWPSLPEAHARFGIRQYFEGYAISGVLGCSKPDPRIFAEGARALGLPPASLLFVDDGDDLVHAAMQLGYRGVALRRLGDPPNYPVPWIVTLDDLDAHL